MTRAKNISPTNDNLAHPPKADQKQWLPNTILEGLGLALLVFDEDLIIQWANPKAEELFNHSKDQMMGKAIDVFLHGDELVTKALLAAIKYKSGVNEQDVILEGPKVKKQIVDLDVSPDSNESGYISVLFKTKPDHQRISNDLMPDGREKSLESMSAVLAHEIKNPLSGIRGAAQLLGQRADIKDQKLTTLIADECDRILHLIDQMQTFSDPAITEPETYNIHEALLHVIGLAKQGFAADVVIEEHFDPSLPPIVGSKNQMIQALLNLLKNAAEALTEQGGRIILTTAWRHDMRFKLSESSDPVFLPIEIKIQDNGTGISDDVANCLFEPFVTNKPHGTGLGLALVKRFVANHGGVISLLNTEMRGACFQLLLPPAENQNSAEKDDNI